VAIGFDVALQLLPLRDELNLFEVCSVISKLVLRSAGSLFVRTDGISEEVVARVLSLFHLWQ
jgi:hypothetical protein